MCIRDSFRGLGAFVQPLAKLLNPGIERNQLGRPSTTAPSNRPWQAASGRRPGATEWGTTWLVPTVSCACALAGALRSRVAPCTAAPSRTG
eukprot:2312210-Alexandrium_andersonii.AAC.1